MDRRWSCCEDSSANQDWDMKAIDRHICCYCCLIRKNIIRFEIAKNQRWQCRHVPFEPKGPKGPPDDVTITCDAPWGSPPSFSMPSAVGNCRWLQCQGVIQCCELWIPSPSQFFDLKMQSYEMQHAYRYCTFCRRIYVYIIYILYLMVNIYIYILAFININVLVCVYIYIYVLVFIYIRVYIYICISIYIHWTLTLYLDYWLNISDFCDASISSWIRHLRHSPMDVELPDAWISWCLLKVEGPRLLGVTKSMYWNIVFHMKLKELSSTQYSHWSSLGLIIVCTLFWMLVLARLVRSTKGQMIRGGR